MKIKWLTLVGTAVLLLTSTVAMTDAKEPNPLYKPSIYAVLPDDMFGPDALCWDAVHRNLYLSVPNFTFDPASPLKAPACLALIRSDGSVEKQFDFPVMDGMKSTGCMGIDFGPDGNLYVCDNQYFFNPEWKSRILRVIFRDGRPTGKVQVVVNGLKVANAILWDGNRVFVTDTILDEPGKYGSGGIWMFSKEELLSAGTDAKHPAIQVAKRGDKRLILVADCDDIGRNNNCGADGITKDKNGIYYFGNYGDGGMFRFRFDNQGKAEMQKIHPGGKFFRCVDGICFDPETNKVYITDSADNAIWAFTPPKWGESVNFERIWENEDTDGADGSLDLPCECRVVDGRLIITNQDVGVGSGGKCQKTDKPYTLSVIEIGKHPDVKKK